MLTGTRTRDPWLIGGELSHLRRDMDICRQKDHKPWSRPSFCGLSGYEQCCLFSSVRTPDITQQQKPASRLLPCTPAPFSFSASFLLLIEKDTRCKGGEKGYGYMPPKGPQTMVETILLWSVSHGPRGTHKSVYTATHSAPHTAAA